MQNQALWIYRWELKSWEKSRKKGKEKEKRREPQDKRHQRCTQTVLEELDKGWPLESHFWSFNKRKITLYICNKSIPHSGPRKTIPWTVTNRVRNNKHKIRLNRTPREKGPQLTQLLCFAPEQNDREPVPSIIVADNSPAPSISFQPKWYLGFCA